MITKLYDIKIAQCLTEYIRLMAGVAIAIQELSSGGRNRLSLFARYAASSFYRGR
jgi:hypothetical protein